MNTEAIKQILQMPGWSDIEVFLANEIKGSKREFSTDGKSDAIVASECRGREIAATTLAKAIKKLNSYKGLPKVKIASYK